MLHILCIASAPNRAACSIFESPDFDPNKFWIYLKFGLGRDYNAPATIDSPHLSCDSSAPLARRPVSTRSLRLLSEMSAIYYNEPLY